MKTKTMSTKDIFTIGLKLLLICAYADLVLSLVNSFTDPTIRARRKAEETAALKELFPGGSFGDKVPLTDKDFPIIKASYTITASAQPAGYILEIAAQGYGGYMKVMASYKSDGEVIGVKLMENEETPGLGKKAENSRYMHKFIGKGGSSSLPVPVTKDMLASQQPDPEAGTTAQPTQNMAVRFLVALLGESSSGDSDSVTGATITFAGVAEAVAAGSAYIRAVKGEN